MDDPIVQPVPSQAHVNPQLDPSITSPKQRDDLNQSFTKFFAEEDAKADQSAPAADPKPADVPEPKAPEPAPEVTEPPVTKKRKASSASATKVPDVLTTQAPAESAPEAKVEPTEAVKPLEPAAQSAKPDQSKPGSPKPDLDALELSSSASPEQKGQFKQLKEITKGYKQEAESSKHELKLFRDTIGPLFKDIGIDLGEGDALVKGLADAANKVRELRSTSLTPEVKSELDLLRGLQRAVDVLHSPEFVKEYSEPRDKLYHDILDDMSKYFDAAPEQVTEFLNLFKTQYKPSQLTSQWWEEQIDTKMPKASKFDKKRIEDKVAKLTDLQMLHDRKAAEVSADQNGYQTWRAKQQDQAAQVYYDQVKAAVEEHFRGSKKHMAEWLPKPTDGVKDVAELEKLLKHNARFDRLQEEFRDYMRRFSSGPSDAALNTLDYLEHKEKALSLAQDLEARETELEARDETIEELKQEVQGLKAEVEKRRKVADVPLRAGAGNAKPTPEKAKLPSGSRGDLDTVFKNWHPNG